MLEKECSVSGQSSGKIRTQESDERIHQEAETGGNKIIEQQVPCRPRQCFASLR